MAGYTYYRTHHFEKYILYTVCTYYRTHHSATVRNSYWNRLSSSRYSTPNFDDDIIVNSPPPSMTGSRMQNKAYLIAELDTSTLCCTSPTNHTFKNRCMWPTSNPDTTTDVTPEAWIIHWDISCLVRHEIVNKKKKCILCQNISSVLGKILIINKDKILIYHLLMTSHALL